MNKLFLLLFTFTLLSRFVFSQYLKSGFNKDEYRELLYISAKTNTPDSIKFDIPEPTHHKMIYKSGVIGLDNRWDLWKNKEPKIFS